MRSIRGILVGVAFGVAQPLAGCDSGGDHGSSEGVLFLAQRPVEGQRVVMEALYEGTVILSDGCIRLGDEPDHHTVVWPPGYSYSPVKGGSILNDRGEFSGVLGGSFRLGGGEVPTPGESGPVSNPVLLKALSECPGRYWLVGDVLTSR